VVGGIAVLLPPLACGVVSLFTFMWIGNRLVVLTVRVVDSQTDQPVANAAVRVFREWTEDDGDASQGRTDAGGGVRLSHRFWTSGTDSLYYRRGGYNALGETLAVEAEGHEPKRVPLADYTGPGWDLYGPPIPPVEVRLPRRDSR
jgi:hypothetical protein